MKLVSTDADRPEDRVEPPPVATPPRPEKRGAYASLVFTATVLIGTVVAIYSLFPARRDETTNEALRAHRVADPTYHLRAPGRAELGAWADGVLGDRPPLPADGPDLAALGASPLEVRHRPAVYVRFALDAYAVSYVVQRARDAPTGRASRTDGDVRLEAWQVGDWTCVAVGPADRAAAWMPRLGVP